MESQQARDGIKANKASKASKAPKLPRVLPAAELPEDQPSYGETYSQLDYQQLDLSEQCIERLHFETVIFSQLLATASRLDLLRLEDVRFAACNLANAVWQKMACVRAEFLNCRMTGFSTQEALFTDTVFRECKIDLGQFYQAKMRGVRFEELREVRARGRKLALRPIESR